jgi:peptidoglycan/xylan/chitin deacetylase (PgdA/CDA1 family)
VLRARLTRFGWVLIGTAAGSLLVLWFCSGRICLVWLGALFTLAGLCIGLGVSFPQWRMFGESLCWVPTGQKVVALTFDDGPDPENTPLLLELLARRGIRVTFFGLGRKVASHPDLARRVVAEGHLLENHSHQHSPWTNLFSVERLQADLSEAQEVIRRVTGRSPAYFRPPMGLTNPRVFRVAKALGLRVTGYTVRGLDRRTQRPERMVARIERRIFPGAIILLHDGGVPAQRLVSVVTMLIDKLEALGYQCLPLDELVAKEDHETVS